MRFGLLVVWKGADVVGRTIKYPRGFVQSGKTMGACFDMVMSGDDDC